MDEVVVRLIRDLMRLEAALDAGDPQVERVARQYLVSNRAIIQGCIDSWRELTEAQRKAMVSEHRELDEVATNDTFDEIAIYALDVAVHHDGLGLVKLTRDKVHMLRRVVQFAVYVTTVPAAKNLEMHPVEEHLPN